MSPRALRCRVAFGIAALSAVLISVPAAHAGSSILGTTGSAPSGIVIDSAGNLYTSNAGSKDVSKVTPSGSSGILASTGSAGSPVGIAIDAAGNLYTANSSASSSDVSKITPDGSSSILAVLPSSGPLRSIAADPSGNVYVLAWSPPGPGGPGSSTIYKITPAGSTSTLGVTGNDITTDAAGNLYVIGGSTITKVDPTGAVTTLGNFSGGGPLAVDSAGNVYAQNLGAIWKVASNGTATNLGSSGLFTVRGIAVDAAGNIFTAGVGLSGSVTTPGVTRITPEGRTRVLGSPASDPSAIVLDQAGNAYTSNRDTNNISKISASAPSLVEDALLVSADQLAAVCLNPKPKEPKPCIEELRRGGPAGPNMIDNLYTEKSVYDPTEKGSVVTLTKVSSGNEISGPFDFRNSARLSTSGIAIPGGSTFMSGAVRPIKSNESGMAYTDQTLEEIGSQSIYLKIRAPGDWDLGTGGSVGPVTSFNPGPAGGAARLAIKAGSYASMGLLTSKGCNIVQLMQRTFLSDQSACNFEDNATGSLVSGYLFGVGPSLGRIVVDGKKISGLESFPSASGAVLETSADSYTVPTVVPDSPGIQVALAAPHKTPTAVNTAYYRMWLPADYAKEAFGLTPDQFTKAKVTVTKLSGRRSSQLTPTFRSTSRDGKEGVEIGVDGVTFSTPRLRIARRGATSVKAKVKTKTSRRTISVTANYGKSASGRPATIGYRKGRSYKPLKKATISRKGLAKFKVRRTSKTKRLGVWLTIQGPQGATRIKAR